MFLIRIVVLPIRVLMKLFGFTVKTGFLLGRVPAKASGRLARLAGFRGWLLFTVGLAVGLLFAPGPGREMRARLKRLLERSATSDSELVGKVAFELAHAPRTWHFDQPKVGVVDGRVILTGEVPTDEARTELGRVAAAIPGVAGVDYQLAVAQ